jgi:hypothetical protein
MRGEEFVMFPMSRVREQSALPKWWVLAMSLVFAPTAFAAAPNVSGPIDPVTAQEDDSDRTFGLEGGIFSDPESEPMSFGIVDAGDSSLVVVSIVGNDLRLDFQPDQNGSTSITISATDTEPSTTNYTFTVNVNALNDPPTLSVASPHSVSFPEDTSPAVIDLTTIFADVDIVTNGDFFNYTLNGNDNTTLVTGASFSGNDLELTLGANQTGVAKLTVEARDQSGQNISLDINVTVDPVADPPVLTSPIADVVTTEDAANVVINLATAFSDPRIHWAER